MTQSPSLPELPKPYTTAKELVGIGERDFFIADQMNAHGLACYEAGSAAAAQAAWQPIATAPKDGTHILACHAGRPYDDLYTFNQAPPSVVHWFGWPEDAAGFYLSVSLGEQKLPFNYTHWKPLGAEPCDTKRLEAEAARHPQGEAKLVCDHCGIDRLKQPCGQPYRPDGCRFNGKALAAAPTQGAEGAAPQAVVGEASKALVLMVDYAIHHGWPYDAQKRIEGIREADKLRAALTPSPIPTAPHQPTNREDAEAGDVNAIRHVAYGEGYRAGKAAASAAPQEADALREALSELVENADSLLNTIGCIQGRDPEEDDTHVHEKWAMDELKRSADEARAALAQHQPQQGEGA